MSSNISTEWGVDINDAVINAETRGPMVAAVLCVCAFLTIVFVSLRMYTRLHILRKPGADDVTIVIAEVFCLATIFVTGMEVRYGLGRHTWVISAEDMAIQQRYLYAVLFVYNTTTNTIKASFLLQYRRLLTGSIMQKICNWALGLIAVWTVVQITILALTCSPLASVVPSMKDHCLPQTPLWIFSSIANIVTDFLVFCIPLPIISRLRMASRKKKITLIALFSMGFFTCIMSVMRAVSLATGRLGTKDSVYNAPIAVIWGIAEITFGIVTSCFMTLRPLARRYIPGFADTAHSGAGARWPGYELNRPRTTNNDMRKRPDTSLSVEGLTNSDETDFSRRGDTGAHDGPITFYRGENSGESSDEGLYIRDRANKGSGKRNTAGVSGDTRPFDTRLSDIGVGK